MKTLEIKWFNVKSYVLLPGGGLFFALVSFVSCFIEVLKLDGNFDFHIPLTDILSIRDVSFMPSIISLVATCSQSLLRGSSIIIIDIKTKSITRSIPMAAGCHGVTYSRECNLLIVASDTGIRTLNLNNGSIKPVTNQKLYGTPYIVVSGGLLYYTNANSPDCFPNV